MSQLSNLTAAGWIATDTFIPLKCDACPEKIWFVRLNAPDCNAWCLAGVGGADSSPYGVYCREHAAA